MSVLIVEDESAIRRLVRARLEAQGVAVTDVATVADALEALRLRLFDVLILDLTLPDGTGLEVLDSVRASDSSTHVIVLSGATSEADRLRALGRGADDYVVKPFFVRELVARVKAVRRRGDPDQDVRLHVGPMILDLGARQVVLDGEAVELTAKEFDLLAYLAARPGHVFSRDELLRAVWHSASEWQQEATVTEHIRRLRTKIESDPKHPQLLSTVRGAGYRLDLPHATDALDGSGRASTTTHTTGTVIHIGGVLVFADQPAADLLGCASPADVLGKQAEGLLAPESVEAARERGLASTTEPALRPQAFTVQHPDGTKHSIDVASHATVWNGQRARQLTLTCAANPSERLLHLATGVFSEVAEAVVVTDLNFHVRSWNQGAERLYGWRRHEVLGRHIAEILPWAGDNGEFAAAWASLESIDRWNGAGKQMTRDKSMIDVVASATVVRDDGGEPIGVVSVSRAASVAAPRPSDELGDDEVENIARQDLEVYYQPIVALADGKVTGVEALLRWHHPELGLVMPSAFMAAAERTGRIVDIGNFVLVRVCEQSARWVQGGADIEVSVNISARQLADPLLVDRISSALDSSGLDPTRLWLEVTETALVRDVDKTAEVLRHIVDQGVRIAIDDFGTGWASLTYLRAFPVHALKIDRSFVAGVDRNPSDAAIARSILSLGAELGLVVVGEGIETTAQRDSLLRLGCTTGQGWLYGKAVPAAEIALRVDSPAMSLQHPAP